MIFQKFTIKLWWVGLFLIGVLSIFYYFILSFSVRSIITKQVLDQESTIARAEANNIETFFQLFSGSVVALSVNPDVLNINSSTKGVFDAFIERWRSTGVVSAVGMTDKSGKIIFYSTTSGVTDQGSSLSDREYFLWAKNKAKKGEYLIGQPQISKLPAARGRVVIPVIMPIYRDGVFDGIVAAGVVLSPFAQSNLEAMKVSAMTDVFLIDSTGNLLFTTSNLVGSENATYELYPKLKDVVAAKKEGTLQTSYTDSRSGKVEEHVVAYSPVILGGQNWLLVTGSSVKKITDITTPVYIRLAMTIILMFFSVFAFGVVAVRSGQKRL